jgi:hypothetical protein
MTKKQYLVWIIQILLFTGVTSLQFVDKESAGTEEGLSKHLCIFIFNHRLAISIVAGSLLAVITGWATLYEPRKRAREIRKKILETLSVEILNDDQNNYRVTIFKRANFFRTLVIYKTLFLHNLRNRSPKAKFIFPKWKNYIIVWDRLGTEHSKSKTFFYYSSDTLKDCQGVAGAVMQAYSDIVADNLPDIDNIDLNTVDMMNKRLLETRNIIDYMDRGYINDFDTLKRLNRKAKHIYGNILNDLRGDPKGVLVIDSFLPVSFLTPEIRQRLSHYATIIGATM